MIAYFMAASQNSFDRTENVQVKLSLCLAKCHNMNTYPLLN